MHRHITAGGVPVSVCVCVRVRERVESDREMFVEYIVYMTIHSPSDYDLSGVHPLVQFHHTLIEIHPYLHLQCVCVCRSTSSCKDYFMFSKAAKCTL